MIRDIFGLQPSDVRAQQQKQQQELVKLQVAQGTNPAIASFGTSIGAGLGRGLMKGFGMEDPAMQEAEANKLRKEQYENALRSIDTSTEEGALEMANLQNQLGNSAVAVQFLQQADKISKNKLAAAERETLKGNSVKALEIINSIEVNPDNPVPDLKKQYLALRNAGLAKSATDVLKEIDLLQSGASRSEGRTSAGQEKTISSLQDDATESFDLANELEVLAQDYVNIDPKSGLVATIVDGFKAVTGQDDEVTQLRAKFNLIRAGVTVNNLPQGAASDADVKLVLDGFLSPTANPETVASFLRGLAKISRYKAERSKFTSNYIGANRTQAGALDAWNTTGKEQFMKQYGSAFTPISEQEQTQGTPLPKGFVVPEETLLEQLTPSFFK